MSTRAASGRGLREGLYYGVITAFYLAPRLLYSLHLDGAQRFRHRPSTLIVTNHKRDLDSVILPPTLLFNGVRPKRPLWFAGRDDMFVRGFLSTYDVVPAWLRRLLYEIDLRTVLDALRIFPVRRFPERTMAEALREVVAVFGDRPVSEVLRPEEADPWMMRRGPQVRLSEVLAWRFHKEWRRPATLRAFVPRWRESLRTLQRQVVGRQIVALAGLLNRGEILYLAPEGSISPDGRLQAFRSALRQILGLAEAPVRLQPVCIVYDFMRPGRMRIFITVGEEMTAEASPAQSEQAVRRALAALHTMTTSQVASQTIWDLVRAGRDTVDLARFTTQVLTLAAALRQEGMRVDEDLFSHGEDRVDGWVRFAARHGLLARVGPELRMDVDRLTSRPATYWENPVRYCVNELQSIRATLNPPPSPSPWPAPAIPPPVKR